MKNPVFLFFLLCCFLSGTAQDFNNYEPLKAKGPIPRDFLTLSSEKSQADAKDVISDDDRRSTRKSKEHFLLSSHFMLDRLRSSGRVLFNDPVSTYLNEILNKVLADKPELRLQVKVYAVRSSSVNAFATNDGTLLVNLGLIAQLETEAQLAYVLSHEIIHYQKEHVMNVFLENEKIEKGKGVYHGNSVDEKILSSSNYSKEVETEADELGFELFKNTPYSTSTIGGVFDVLHYAYLPFDDIEFEKSFFETEYLVFPDDYFLEEVSPFSPFEEKDDSRSSHPSTYKRKLLIGNKADKVDNAGKSNQVISDEKFENIRTICRFELSRLYFNNLEYELAIYNSYMLLKEYPESKYLKKNIAKSLYSIAKYSNKRDFYHIHTRYKEIEGSSQQLYHLMEKMDPLERNALALRYAWDLKTEYPEDEDLKNICDDLMEEFALHHYDEGFFMRELPKDKDDPEKLDTIPEEELSKYDKIRMQQKDVNVDDNYIRKAFVDLFQNDLFAANFYDAVEEAEDELAKEEDYKYLAAEHRKEAKWEKLVGKHGHAIGAEKAVIVSPLYLKMDLRKDDAVKYGKSEEAMLKFYERINNSASLMDLNTELLAMQELTTDDAERFNDIAFLTEWVSKRFDQLDADIVNMETEKLKALAEKYNTRYFSWTGVFNFRKSNISQMQNLCIGLIFYPYLPIALYQVAKPNYETYYYYVTFDMETGDPVMYAFNTFPMGDARDYINMNIYDSLYQLKSDRKNEE